MKEAPFRDWRLEIRDWLVNLYFSGKRENLSILDRYELA